MRVFHYSHDYYGIDHLQQTLTIAERVAFEFPEATQLLVTGSPQPRGVKLPKRLDYIKLPSMDESSKSAYHAPSLSLPYGVIKTLRETIILDAIRYFKPDIVSVEAADEAQAEVAYALNHLKQGQIKTKFMAGMGDLTNAVMMIRGTLTEAAERLPHFLSAKTLATAV